MATDADLISDVMKSQVQSLTTLFGQMVPAEGTPEAEATVQWAEVAGRLHSIWTEFQVEQLNKASADKPPHYADPMKWIATVEGVFRQLPLANPEMQQKLWNEGLALVNAVFGQYGIGPRGEEIREQPELPRRDHRFSDPEWRRQPFFAMLHQLYLLMSEQVTGLAESIEGLEPARKAQLLFATRTVVDALSPANFPLTNPVALAKASETRGESLVRGFENLLDDMRKGQLTHTRPGAFVLGENIAVTPGKVVFETPLYQLIQYTPTTDKVLKTPLVIFPPWINRFYILDLNARKSFVRWAVEQGVTVFMVSWKSADASMADLLWDDYIAAQIEAVDFARNRLGVPSAHTIGYCVAGTTLAATLAVLARKGEADKIASATFFTAQVDFEDAGDLKNFIDDQQIETVGRLSPEGYLDGRYLAATFNILRGNDLIWNYVERNYLKGEDYPAFDLLHWNGDVTNLPALWHRNYLRDLYRDNRLAVADSLSACGVPIDLHRIATPCYIQAGREDHIAPPTSVWKLTRYLAGNWAFLLAGSGHIAGVVNPPSTGKYQYWTNDGSPESLADFVEGATEHPGSWWPHWAEWLRNLDPAEVPARGRRKPGGRGDKIVEDAPGRYVSAR
ncbi:alpha/beta fold hydrolase [Novosphingobium resinovorum]|uniref:Class I poly(R)-hydroxyalkanoic acid synthase n=1 Tax=Novosphingobium resinovorum TaxID=158500 RepID=A0A1D8A4S4_9SPHN|nr:MULTISPECIES: alpha/beta fold hydrolase [Sphingomonadaceae]AOR77108.1 class I poly(R)-hydroxyalkanoic acid synthase [Novosphingobium resinovorum]EJU09831.1 polyhydroxyalkanoate synthase [Sphingomonas sp. LH128]MBF7012504.1 alpha/beta fold hydrolase [Novosphingobium sp. HR1a]WJM27239.1 alpha/beta fold hydrolase [Novosphingobium resinovorum]